ncbi:alpha-L-fucosidase [Paenibacillus sp. yr247]|uniref:alpha-L-fucosidase n=1 Tax=Paenibacillus sp. yr247 TaxID=1761880 RepID=UPI00088273AB|nr:alpha-L-fucosidase [Paenibacillus sp. yr247]SDO35458.1 alpha-L-fucosidase [Paenibacillus sp. yr247]
MAHQQLVKRQQWFVNQRFGMFIHFNSATFQFADTEIKDWEFAHENNDEPRRFPFDPKDWNPDQLDCSQWARAAKSAGMKFAALTAKHHEGFSLWPTRYSDHCVKNSPCKTDIVKEYLDAFRQEGISAGLYFSMLDLHHQIGRKKCSPEDNQFIKNQIEELLTGYGDLPFLIIDGWNAPWGGPYFADLPFNEIDELVKKLQPDCLLMNISGESDLDGTDIVFYENAAGQEIADFFAGPGASCNILTDTWFWRTYHPTMEQKSADWALDKIVNANKHNCSFLLNGAPNQHGLLDANVLDRFKEIGERFHPPADLQTLPNKWLYRK